MFLFAILILSLSFSIFDLSHQLQSVISARPSEEGFDLFVKGAEHLVPTHLAGVGDKQFPFSRCQVREDVLYVWSVRGDKSLIVLLFNRYQHCNSTHSALDLKCYHFLFAHSVTSRYSTDFTVAVLKEHIAKLTAVRVFKVLYPR